MKINNIHQKNKFSSKGFSLVEMIIYISILSIVTAVLVATSASLLGTFSGLKAYEEIAHSSTVALERISREIRRAESVDVPASTLSSNPGALVLDTTDLSDIPTTVTISVVGGRIMLQESAIGTPSPLTTVGVTISNITFTHTIGTNTEGVLIELTAEKDVQGITSSRQFRTFVVLDGS